MVLLACGALTEVVATEEDVPMLDVDGPALVATTLDAFDVDVEVEPLAVTGTVLVSEFGETLVIGVVATVSVVPLPFVEQAASRVKQLDTTQAAEV